MKSTKFNAPILNAAGFPNVYYCEGYQKLLRHPGEAGGMYCPCQISGDDQAWMETKMNLYYSYYNILITQPKNWYSH